MKKIISLGIASAVCAIVAVSASADAIMAYDVTGEVTKGSDITIVVKATADVNNFIGVIETAGLEVKEVVANANAQLNSVDLTTGKVGLGSLTGNLATAGETVCEIKATVTAGAGEKISFFIKGTSDKEAEKLPAEALVVEVKGATESNSDTSSESKPDSKPDSSEGNGGSTNPPTGVALAVVPAVLAAAGVIVAKKRK
ncbi:MAG: hypothetical protein ACI4QY_05905 [Oscillospiraceae bacterium]